jgi:PhnB protein
MNPYLNFDGNCAEAMKYYAGIFGTEPEIQRFSDAPIPAPPGTEDRVMHASFRVGDTTLMASDTMPGMPFAQGSNVHLSVAFADRDEQTRIFEALADGGSVDMPLADQFFGRFGMLTDRFGVKWMVIRQTPEGD